MNHSNDSTMSSFQDLTEDSLDETITESTDPLATLPHVTLNILAELKTLTRVAARDPTVETEDETLADLDQLQLDLERLLSHRVLMRRSFQSTLEAMSDSVAQDSSGGGPSITRGRRKMSRIKRTRHNSYVKKRRGTGNTPKINVEILADLPCTAQTVGTPVKAGSAGIVGTNGKTPVKLNGTISHVPGSEHKAGKTPSKNQAKGNRSSSLCYIPKNNSAETFWQSVRVYVDHVGDADVKIIEDMLKMYETETIPDIPALGDHYTRSITDPAQLLSITTSLKRFKSSAHGTHGTRDPMDNGGSLDSLALRIKAGSEHIMLNNNLQLPHNLIDQIVSVLNQCNQNGDENEVPNLESPAPPPLGGHSKPLAEAGGEGGYHHLKPLGDGEAGTDVVRLNGDAHSGEEEEESDEVLAEILKCRNELSLVRGENSRMLSCLLAKLVLESRRNKVKQKLEAIDAELCSIVRKLNSARSQAANSCAASSSLLHPRSPGPQATPSGCTRGDAHQKVADTPSSSVPGRSPIQLKIGRYRKRALLYLKMRACMVTLLEQFTSSHACQRLVQEFESSMDIDAYLLKHIMEGEEISLPQAS